VDEDDRLTAGGIGGGNLGRFAFSDVAAGHLGSLEVIVVETRS
jgi:hypothetical protein